MLTLNAFQLRWLADAASGYRGADGEPLYVAPASAGDGPFELLPADPTTGLPPAGALLELDTFDINPQRPPTTQVEIWSGTDHADLVPTYDAVFWTESAVEKFVLPYYASKSLWEAADALYRLTYYWYRKLPLDITDSPPTGRLTVDDSVPVAIAHTPDSEWVAGGLEGNNSGGGLDKVVGWETHLLFRDGKGNLKPVRLSDLPDPPPDWPGR